MSRYNGVLFTDIDGTFFRWSLFLYLFVMMRERRMFKPEAALKVQVALDSWRSREGEYESYLLTSIKVFEDHLKGIPAEQLYVIAAEVLAERRQEVYRYTRWLIQDRLNAGWAVIAISASWEVMVKMFADSWGLTDAHGSEYEVRDGIFTGNRNILDYNRKAEIVNQVLAHPDFANMDRADVWACGDTKGDMAMFERVGRPICFNPSSALAAIAETRGWEMVVERKDMVHRMHQGQYNQCTFDVSGQMINLHP